MADKTPAKGRKRYGLILTLPGAPPVRHRVAGLPGFYRPDEPTPVGGDGECPLDLARSASDDPGCDVNLVELDNPTTKE